VTWEIKLVFKLTVEIVVVFRRYSQKVGSWVCTQMSEPWW